MPRYRDKGKTKHSVIIHGRPHRELRVHLQPSNSPRAVVLMALCSKALFPSPVPGQGQKDDHWLTSPSALPCVSITLYLFAQSPLCLSTPSLAPGLPARDGKALPRSDSNLLPLLLRDFPCPMIPVVPSLLQACNIFTPFPHWPLISFVLFSAGS